MSRASQVLLDETFPCLPVADRARAGATGVQSGQLSRSQGGVR